MYLVFQLLGLLRWNKKYVVLSDHENGLTFKSDAFAGHWQAVKQLQFKPASTLSAINQIHRKNLHPLL